MSEKENVSHLLTMQDFQSIIGYAKSHWKDISLPATMSGQEVYPNEVQHIAMIESVIVYLNKNNLLTKMVNIDITTKTNK